MEAEPLWVREEVRPALRGRIHLLAAVVALALAPLFAQHATEGTQRIAGIVFACSISVCFGVSAAFHIVDWRPPWDLRMKRADHVGIFVLLAGTYTGVGLVLLDGWLRVVVVTGGWLAVGYGTIGAAFGLFERRGAANTSYITLGWLAVLMMPAMVGDLSSVDLALLVAGGVIYTAGAVALAQRKPVLWPDTFGYHEVWHVMTVLAAMCHAAVVWSVTG